MLKFHIAPIFKAEATPEALAVWELLTLFLGEASVQDIPMDEDECRNWYINTMVAPDSREDYLSEPQTADAEMVESFAAALRSMAQERALAMGAHYPFILTAHGSLVRRDGVVQNDAWNLDAIGACYLSLQFNRALSFDMIEFDGEDDQEVKDQKDKFNNEFRNLFEYIAGYAVSGQMNGVPFMTSHCRSSENLDFLLRQICRRVGVGAVRSYQEWDDEHKNVNDGGVDCLVYSGGPEMRGVAEIALVGATVQKKKLDQKFMTPDKIAFYGNFFSKKPAAFKGVFVHHEDESAYNAERCRTRNCLYFSYESIWKFMGARNGNGYQKKSLLKMDSRARRILKKFGNFNLSYEFEEFCIASPR